MGRGLGLAWLVCLALYPSVPAFAKAPQQESAKVPSAAVETRFAPPVDVPQRFRLTVTKRGQTLSWIEEVRFERAGDGYIAYWRMDSASFTAQMRHPMLAPSTRPFTGAPLAFDLDGEGNLLAVRDWETQKRRLLKSVEDSRPLVLNGSGLDPKVADSVLLATKAMFGQMDAERGAAVILKNLAPIFGWGGHALQVGEAVEATEQVDVPLFGTQVERRVRLTLTSLQSGVAQLTVRSEIDGAALRATMEKARAMAGASDPTSNARFAQSMAQLDRLKAVQATTVMLDLATGLPRRIDITVSADGETGEVVLIERQNR